MQTAGGLDSEVVRWENNFIAQFYYGTPVNVFPKRTCRVASEHSNKLIQSQLSQMRPSLSQK